MLDFSAISQDLLIGVTPKPGDYEPLRALGVKLVINMRFARGPYPDAAPEPLSFLWLRSIDSPFFLIPLQNLLKGTQLALETIQKGGRVYVHCARGRHRSVAMGAAILIAQGHAVDEAIRLIKAGRPISDPDIFYIRRRILEFGNTWRGLHP